jgi:DNA polymerase-3 subunit alpha
MEIAKQIGGFSQVCRTPTISARRSGRDHSLMASLKEKFLEGAAARATSVARATQLWKDMEKSQDYSFNKSHAACYALIAYRTAWLRRTIRASTWPR